MVKGTRYKKVRDRGGGTRYGHRVHLVFWCEEPERFHRAHWRFVCGKLQSPALEFDLNANDVDDLERVTCRGCNKQAPDVVERMGTFPDIMEFQ